jgi:plasmid stabilization system protein ParE
MLKVRWSTRSIRDLDEVAAFWNARDSELAGLVLATIEDRVGWLADDHFHLGVRVTRGAIDRRWYLERRYGHKIYYRVLGEPPDGFLVLRVRHARQRPPRINPYGNSRTSISNSFRCSSTAYRSVMPAR